MTRQNFTRVYDRQLYLSGGNVCADVFNGARETICSAHTNYADGQWHQAAQVLSGGAQLLYVDGALAASGVQGQLGLRRAGRSRARLGACRRAAHTSPARSTRCRCSRRR